MKLPNLLAIIPTSICGALWGAYAGNSRAVSSTDMFVHADDLRHINIIVFGAVGFIAGLIVGALFVKFAPKASPGVAVGAAVFALVPIGLVITSNKVEAQKYAEVSVQDRARDDKLKKDGLAALDEIGTTLGLQTIVRDEGWQDRSYAVNGTAQQMHDQLVGLGAVQSIDSDPGFYSMNLSRNGHMLHIFISTEKDGKTVVNFSFNK